MKRQYHVARIIESHSLYWENQNYCEKQEYLRLYLLSKLFIHTELCFCINVVFSLYRKFLLGMQSNTFVLVIIKLFQISPLF